MKSYSGVSDRELIALGKGPFERFASWDQYNREFNKLRENSHLRNSAELISEFRKRYFIPREVLYPCDFDEIENMLRG